MIPQAERESRPPRRAGLGWQLLEAREVQESKGELREPRGGFCIASSQKEGGLQAAVLREILEARRGRRQPEGTKPIRRAPEASTHRADHRVAPPALPPLPPGPGAACFRSAAIRKSAALARGRCHLHRRGREYRRAWAWASAESSASP